MPGERAQRRAQGKIPVPEVVGNACLGGLKKNRLYGAQRP
jgi:hypothetical protein